MASDWHALGSSTLSVDSQLNVVTTCAVRLSPSVSATPDASSVGFDGLPWISCGRPLRLHLHPTVNGQPLVAGGLLLQCLQQSLTTARMWSQLGLEVRPTDPSSPLSSSVCMSLHQQHATAANRHPAARLLRGAPYADTQPPAGIPSYVMNAVRLDVALRLDNPSTLAAATLVQAVDCGLRLAIAAKPPRLPKGVRLLDDARDWSLETIAPAIWRAGGTKDVAERACYLPTISRAVAKTRRGAGNGRACSERLWAIMMDGLEAQSKTAPLKPLTAAESIDEASDEELLWWDHVAVAPPRAPAATPELAPSQTASVGDVDILRPVADDDEGLLHSDGASESAWMDGDMDDVDDDGLLTWI